MVHRIAPAACQHVLQSRLSLQMFQQMMVHKQQLPNILRSLRSCSQKGDCLQYCPSCQLRPCWRLGRLRRLSPVPSALMQHRWPAFSRIQPADPTDSRDRLHVPSALMRSHQTSCMQHLTYLHNSALICKLTNSTVKQNPHTCLPSAPYSPRPLGLQTLGLQEAAHLPTLLCIDAEVGGQLHGAVHPLGDVHKRPVSEDGRVKGGKVVVCWRNLQEQGDRSSEHC